MRKYPYGLGMAWRRHAEKQRDNKRNSMYNPFFIKSHIDRQRYCFFLTYAKKRCFCGQKYTIWCHNYGILWNNLLFFCKIFCHVEKKHYLCSRFRKWYLARAVRDRSAKPGTAVRIRQVPQKKSRSVEWLFLSLPLPLPEGKGMLDALWANGRRSA